MSKILIFCLFFALNNVIFGAKLEGCIDRNGNLQKLGEPFQIPGICQNSICEKDGVVAEASCGLIGLPYGCKNGIPVPEDPSKPYPECCGYYNCTEKN